VLLLAFQHSLLLGQSLAESGRIASAPAVGLPFLIFTGLAVWLFVGSRTRPGDTPISRLVLAMSAQFRRFLKMFQRKERAA
jgi:lipopolysaccharide export system permease protein